MNAKGEGHEKVSGKLKGGKERAKLVEAMRKELELLDSTKVSGTWVRAASGRRAAPPRVGRGATRVPPPGGSDDVTLR